MNKLYPLFFVLLLPVTTCNDREDYFAGSNKNVKVTLESPLTSCTPTNPGFINSDYAFNITLTPEYSKANPLPLIAQYTCENLDIPLLAMGNKPYSPDDTIIFNSLSKKMVLNVPNPGTYKLLIHFYMENKMDEILGKYELNFVIGTPDLNMYIVRDGKRVENMEETENFLGYEGSFIVRVNSEREELNKGRLKLTANITGSSVQVKNWRDNEAKISQTDDLPETVDFLIEYKNVALGKTRFMLTAESQNSNTVLRDSMNVQESKPGTLTLNTTYNEEKNFYSREELWVGQTDSVGYLITPDTKAVSNVFRMKFEMKDPGKLWFFDTGDPKQHFSNHQYESNKWYDFSGRLNGKIYYVFPSPTSYSDTVIISLQNGDMGQITKYKLLVSCKQSDDFDFNVTFKPELTEGYDVIKLSELREGFNELIILDITDENPYSKFDYNFGSAGDNEQQRNLVFMGEKTGYENMSDIPFGTWLAMDYGYLTDLISKSFNIICANRPNDNTAERWLGTFNWIYDAKRISDGKTKTVTRQIKIIDDRMNFLIDLAPGNNRESAYQNEIVTAYQLKYQAPSLSADDYTLTVTSNNEVVADVYLMNKDHSFRKAIFGSAEIPSATHAPEGTSLADSDRGQMQIKGKEAGTATLSFTLKHKTSGATKTINKTVTTIADPVEYEIEAAPTIDAMNKEREPIPFGEKFHTYQNPRFRIKLHKSKVYEYNTLGTASVVFSTVASLTNVAKLTIKGGATGQPGHYWNTSVDYGMPINMAYDTDYFVTVNAPTSLPWNVPVGSEQFLNIKMIKATDRETKIAAEYNDEIKYELGAYNPPKFTVDATTTRHDYISHAESYIETYAETSPYMFRCSVESEVAVYPNNEYPGWKVTIQNGSASYYVSNATTTGESKLNDANETSNVSLKTDKATYFVTRAKGAYIEIDNNEDYYLFPQCTTYHSIQVDVTDNWGCKSTVYFAPPSKFELLNIGRW